MVNPFDRTFFRFLIGFTLMLAISFSILYIVGKYSKDIDGVASSALK